MATRAEPQPKARRVIPGRPGLSQQGQGETWPYRALEGQGEQLD